jgi:YbgC/YbaW family acyl-CoA thioester hydrolase
MQTSLIFYTILPRRDPWEGLQRQATVANPKSKIENPNPMPFTYTRRVAFAETDMAGIVHFSNYNRYMEEAEHAFLKSVGVPMIGHDKDGWKLSWPRVRAACSFVAPARYDEILEISVAVTRVGEKSLSFEFQLRRGETHIATGELTTVYCRFRPDQPMESLPIPDEYRKKLGG